MKGRGVKPRRKRRKINGERLREKLLNAGGTVEEQRFSAA